MGHYDCKVCDASPHEEHSSDCSRYKGPTEDIDNIESCPSCGALPCDWVNNPHPPSGSELPTWPELCAYWKARALAAEATVKPNLTVPGA